MEGPEIKLTAEYLTKALEGKVITDWEFTSGQYSDDFPDGFQNFVDSLPLMVSKIACKGKLIVMTCFSEYRTVYILHSLRKTGSWREGADEYTRWQLNLSNNKKLYFSDEKCLSSLCFTEDEDDVQNTLNKLGVDILSSEFTLEAWKKACREHKNKNITSFLMDQHVVSGCGNYLKSEVLYYAKISPLRKVKELTERELEKIFEGIFILSRQSYLNRGLGYTDSKGRSGFFEHSLKVYQKKSAKSLRTPDGRTTYCITEEQK